MSSSRNSIGPESKGKDDLQEEISSRGLRLDLTGLFMNPYSGFMGPPKGPVVSKCAPPRPSRGKALRDIRNCHRIRYEEEFNPVMLLASCPKDLNANTVRCFRGNSALKELRSLRGEFWGMISSIRQFIYELGVPDSLGLPYLIPGKETVPIKWAHFLRTGTLRFKDLDLKGQGTTKIFGTILKKWKRAEELVAEKLRVARRKTVFQKRAYQIS